MIQCNFNTLVCEQDQITKQMEYEDKINSSLALKSFGRSGTIILLSQAYYYL